MEDLRRIGLTAREGVAQDINQLYAHYSAGIGLDDVGKEVCELDLAALSETLPCYTVGDQKNLPPLRLPCTPPK